MNDIKNYTLLVSTTCSFSGLTAEVYQHQDRRRANLIMKDSTGYVICEETHANAEKAITALSVQLIADCEEV